MVQLFYQQEEVYAKETLTYARPEFLLQCGLPGSVYCARAAEMSINIPTGLQRMKIWPISHSLHFRKKQFEVNKIFSPCIKSEFLIGEA